MQTSEKRKSTRTPRAREMGNTQDEAAKGDQRKFEDVNAHAAAGMGGVIARPTAPRNVLSEFEATRMPARGAAAAPPRAGTALLSSTTGPQQQQQQQKQQQQQQPLKSKPKSALATRVEGSNASCEQCGKDATASFCTSCGLAQRIAGETSAVTAPQHVATFTTTMCSACGAKLVPDARFCHECGAGSGADSVRISVACPPNVEAVLQIFVNDIPWTQQRQQPRSDSKQSGQVPEQPSRMPVPPPPHNSFASSSGPRKSADVDIVTKSIQTRDDVPFVVPAEPLVSGLPAKKTTTTVATREESIARGAQPRQIVRALRAGPPPTLPPLGAKRDPSRFPFKMVIIGQTGSGKSTFVNMMCNYFRKGSLGNLRVLIPTRYLASTEPDSVAGGEHDARDVTVAQTKQCAEYEFVHELTGARFVVVDTPGLGDTGGVKQDERNIANIMEFCSGIGYVDYIAIVVNGASSRLDVSMRTICQRFHANLPPAVLNQVALVCTNCTKLTCTFDVGIIERNLLGPGVPIDRSRNVFFAQNTFFSTNPTTWTRDDVESELQPDWAKSMAVLDALLGRVAATSIAPASTQDFRVMRDTRDMLKARMANVLGQLCKVDQVQLAIAQYRAVLMAHSYGEWKSATMILAYESVDCVTHNTSCLVHQVTCHEMCGEEEKDAACVCYGTNDNGLLLRCRVCAHVFPKTCGPANHYYDCTKWKDVEASVGTIVDSLCDLYGYCLPQEGREGLAVGVDADSRAMNQIADELLGQLVDLCRGSVEIVSRGKVREEVQSIIDFWECQKDVVSNTEREEGQREFFKRVDGRIAVVLDVVALVVDGKVT